MKVIPKPEKDFTLSVECGNCETTLVLEKSDVSYGDFYSGMDAEMSMDFYVDCPVCKAYVFIDEKKLPRHVKFAAMKVFEDNGRKRVRKA